MFKAKIAKEVKGIAFGLYRWNAKTAKWYAFCCNNVELTSGEFVFQSEGIPTAENFDGYIDLKTEQLIDLR
ncbi:MAG: hypothetical protein DRJ10_01210 [Bacteroidetes bacterium]|nr:MAG: hypothetical protein DRJ10_01210 [Bacteroidota bacterium]